MLWHPESPGIRVLVTRPSLLRRAGIIRSEFATLGECLNKHSRIVFYPLTPMLTADRDLTSSPK